MRRVLIGLLLTASFLAAKESQAQLGKTYKNEEWGFSMKPPKAWNAVPPSPNDKNLVVAFKADREVSVSVGRTRFSLTPQLDVLLFKIVEITGSESKPHNPFVDGFQSLSQYLERRQVTLDEPKKREINKIPVEEYQYNMSGNSGDIMYKAYVFRGDGLNIALVFHTMESRFKKDGKVWEAAARSFKWIERESRAVKKEGESDQDRFLREQIEALPPGWDHMFSNRKRYLLLFDADKGFVKKMERHLEAMRDYYETIFPLDKPITAVSICRVCQDRETYQAYGGPPGTGGYWSPSAKELVMFVDKESNRNSVFSVVSHEAFHQYIYYFYGELSPHSWYNEGHGDFFGGAKMSASGKKVLKVEPLTVQGFDRYGLFKEMVREGRTIPLQDFMSWTQAQYYEGNVVHDAYAQGWSFIYFLRNGPREGARVKKEWIQMLDDYLANLVLARDEIRGREGERKVPAFRVGQIAQKEAFKSTFQSWSENQWQELQEAWLSFYN